MCLGSWVTFLRALARGHHRNSLMGLYVCARSILIHKEQDFDTFDLAFAAVFKGNEHEFASRFSADALDAFENSLFEWLQDPKAFPALSDEDRAKLDEWDWDKLHDEFKTRLNEQDERHDGGSHWIGTGGTSPFGHGGVNPAGIRVGGAGGGRSAVQVAGQRRFKNLRDDRVLDTRQMGAALRKLRHLVREGAEDELDLPETIRATGSSGGEIDLVFRKPRLNKTKVMLLMDVGGSMDPHSQLCERLFSAASQLGRFQKFESYYFHNCVYEEVFTNIYDRRPVFTRDLLEKLNDEWSLIFVGDAWMSPYELTHIGGAIEMGHHNPVSGLEILGRLRKATRKALWLNPEPKRIWGAESIRMIRELFPMSELTLAGLEEGIETLRRSA